MYRYLAELLNRLKYLTRRNSWVIKCRELSVTMPTICFLILKRRVSVVRAKLWTAIMEIGAPVKINSLVQLTWTDIISRVPRNQLLEPCETKIGLRTGAPFSTLLFNIIYIKPGDLETNYLVFPPPPPFHIGRQCCAGSVRLKIRVGSSSGGFIVNPTMAWQLTVGTLKK